MSEATQAGLRRPVAIALDLLVDVGRLRVSNRTDQAAGTIAHATARRLEQLGYAHHLEILAVPSDAGRALVDEGLHLPPFRYPHGTNACYVIDGCRCDRCKRARRAYDHKRTLTAARGETLTVDAGPVRDHVRALMCGGKRGAHHGGVGLKQIAKVSGVAQGTLWKLMYGAPDRPGPSKVVRTETARKLLAVTKDHMADGATVPAGPTRRMLDAMVAGGFTKAELGRYLTGNPKAASLQIARPGQRSVSVKHAKAVTKLHRQWRAGKIAPQGRRNRHNPTPAAVVPPAHVDGTVQVECVDCGGETLAGGVRCLTCFQATATGATSTGCGTAAGYRAHLRAGHKACQACRDAHVLADQVRREVSA